MACESRRTLRRLQLMASCSEDTTVKVWGIPEDGFKETETEALIDLHGHGRKVTLLRFHPTANNVLARWVGSLTVSGGVCACAVMAGRCAKVSA